MVPEISAEKQRGRPFSKGQSGNPAGKPRGTRNRLTVAAEQLLEGEAEALTRKAIELALAGDTTALRLCLERVAPPRKDRPVNLALPTISRASDASAAMQIVLNAVSDGQITPAEGVIVAGLIESQRRLLGPELGFDPPRKIVLSFDGNRLETERG